MLDEVRAVATYHILATYPVHTLNRSDRQLSPLPKEREDCPKVLYDRDDLNGQHFHFFFWLVRDRVNQSLPLFSVLLNEVRLLG